jgi:hypothetical protein
VLDFINFDQLAVQKLAVGVDFYALRPQKQAFLKAENKSCIFGDIIGSLAYISADLFYDFSVTADHHPHSAGAGIPLAGAVDKKLKLVSHL